MMRRFRTRTAVSAVAFLVTAGIAITAQAAPQQSAQVDELRRRVAELEATIAEMRSAYDARFEAIEAQLASLADAEQVAAPEQTEEPAGEAMSDEERAELERELAVILGEQPAAAGGGGQVADPGAAPGAAQRFSSQTRMLNRLNPEISATGDLFGVVSDTTGDPESNQFRLADFELALQSTLDPYSSAKFAIVQEDGELSVEEAYMEFTSLPGRLGVKAGQTRLDWGKLNRWHQHALPQADRPLVHQTFFGEDGLTGLGATVSWLPPAFLGDYNEVLVQVVNDDNDVAFSGRGFDQPVYLIHETNYFDISPASYFELGLSATTGTNDLAGDFRTQVYGADWNFNWSPPATALYRGFELRGELLWQRRNGPGGVTSSLGAYTYGLYKLNRRSFVGLRGDWTELPLEPGLSAWGVSPYFEWWQSEWVRMRFQYSYLSRQEESPEAQNKFYFQLTWAMGPHKHERY